MSWPKPPSAVTRVAKANPNVKTPNSELPSFRATTTTSASVASFDPISAIPRQAVLARIRWPASVGALSRRELLEEPGSGERVGRGADGRERQL